MGGAVDIAGSAVFVAESLVCSDNTAVSGGCLVVHDTSICSEFTLDDGLVYISMTDAVFKNNLAQVGAAVSYMGNTCPEPRSIEVDITFTNATFINNTATLGGGGLYLNGKPFSALDQKIVTVRFYGLDMIGNEALLDGGAMNVWPMTTTSVTVLIRDALFLNNRADDNGG